MTPAEQIKEKIASLDSALIAQHPSIRTLLRTIHQELKSNPEVVTILSEEEVATIVSSLKKITGLEISAKVVNNKTKTLKSIGVSDL